MNKKLLAANWKMNLNKSSATELTNVISGFSYDNSVLELVLFPPHVYIDAIASQIRNSNVLLGAQNCSHEPRGAFTGEVSPEMLKELNCKYVIIGHSERRLNFFENDELISKKILLCQNVGLHPILCIGESLEIYKKKKTIEVILNQLKNSLSDKVAFSNITIAYEPIWAIGSGLIPKAEEIKSIVRELKKFTSDKCRIVYGGSVNQKNINELIHVDNLDGFLVGNASLDPEEFKHILNIYQLHLTVDNSARN